MRTPYTKNCHTLEIIPAFVLTIDFELDDVPKRDEDLCTCFFSLSTFKNSGTSGSFSRNIDFSVASPALYVIRPTKSNCEVCPRMKLTHRASGFSNVR